MVNPQSVRRLTELAATWGMVEHERNRQLHAAIVAAHLSGTASTDLWAAYLAVAEPNVDFAHDPIRSVRGRAGLAIMQAIIWLEAGEPPHAINLLLLAETTARNLGWTKDEAQLSSLIDTCGTDAEQLHGEAYFYEGSDCTADAVACYRQAIDRYTETGGADRSLTPEELGRIYRHTAECYLGLLQLGVGNPEELQDMVVLLLLNSQSLLSQSPQGHLTTALIGRLQREAWWDHTVGRA